MSYAPLCPTCRDRGYVAGRGFVFGCPQRCPATAFGPPVVDDGSVWLSCGLALIDPDLVLVQRTRSGGVAVSAYDVRSGA